MSTVTTEHHDQQPDEPGPAPTPQAAQVKSPRQAKQPKSKQLEPVPLPDDGRPLWNRLNGEGDRAFQYFSKYLAMGPDRNLDRLRGAAMDAVKGVSVGGATKNKAKQGEAKRRTTAPSWETLKDWATVYHWATRISAWTDYEAAQVRAKQIEVQKEMVERHGTMLHGLHAVLEMEVERWMRKISKEMDNPDKLDKPVLDIDNMRKLADTVVKLERLTRGVPTEINENQQTGSGGLALEKMSREERVRVLDAMCGGEGPDESRMEKWKNADQHLHPQTNE